VIIEPADESAYKKSSENTAPKVWRVTFSNEKGVERLEKLSAMKSAQNDRPSPYRWL